MRDEDDPAGDAPARLVRDLQALHPPGDVPAAIDREILRRSAQALAARRRRRFLLLRALPVAATAAAAGLLLWFFPRVKVREPFAREDVDRNGRVDIVDAYALALRIEEQDLDPSERQRFDFDRDGVIGRGDVDLVASAAVRIRS